MNQRLAGLVLISSAALGSCGAGRSGAAASTATDLPDPDTDAGISRRALVLLDVATPGDCGGSACAVTTFAQIPLNPAAASRPSRRITAIEAAERALAIGVVGAFRYALAVGPG